MVDVRVRLRGGPEDGRDVSIDADTSGRPVPRVSFPARCPHGAPAPPTPPPMLVYERHSRRADGVWIFRYIGIEFD